MASRRRRGDDGDGGDGGGDESDEWLRDEGDDGDEAFEEEPRSRSRAGGGSGGRGGGGSRSRTVMRRHWTDAEDEAVLQAVYRVTGRRDWGASDGPSNSQMTEIIKAVPGRTKKQVRERWFHKLNPGIVDAPWG